MMPELEPLTEVELEVIKQEAQTAMLLSNLQQLELAHDTCDEEED